MCGNLAGHKAQTRRKHGQSRNASIYMRVGRAIKRSQSKPKVMASTRSATSELWECGELCRAEPVDALIDVLWDLGRGIVGIVGIDGIDGQPSLSLASKRQERGALFAGDADGGKRQEAARLSAVLARLLGSTLSSSRTVIDAILIAPLRHIGGVTATRSTLRRRATHLSWEFIPTVPRLRKVSILLQE